MVYVYILIESTSVEVVLRFEKVDYGWILCNMLAIIPLTMLALPCIMYDITHALNRFSIKLACSSADKHPTRVMFS